MTDNVHDDSNRKQVSWKGELELGKGLWGPGGSWVRSPFSIVIA